MLGSRRPSRTVVWVAALGLLITVGVAAGWAIPRLAATPSTLEDYLNPSIGVPNQLIVKLEAYEVERLAAACMRRLDLPYESMPEEVAPGQDLSPTEFARRFGFGITTDPPEATVVGEDPNMSYAATLTEPDRASYLASLIGQPGATQPSGCRPTANDEVYGFRQRALAPLRADLDALSTKIAADPANGEAEARWASCMAGAGFDVDAHAQLEALVTSTVSVPFDRLPPDAGGDDLVALQDLERRLAVAQVSCDEPWASDLKVVRDRYATVFIESHADLLSALKQSLIGHYEELAKRYGVSPAE